MGPIPNFHTPQPPKTKKWGVKNVSKLDLSPMYKYIGWVLLGGGKCYRMNSLAGLANFFAAMHRFLFFSFDHSIKSKTRPICVKILMPLHYGKFQGLTRQICHMVGRTLQWGVCRVIVFRHERWHHTSRHSRSWDNFTCYITSYFSCVRVKSFYLPPQDIRDVRHYLRGSKTSNFMRQIFFWIKVSPHHWLVISEVCYYQCQL